MHLNQVVKSCAKSEDHKQVRKAGLIPFCWGPWPVPFSAWFRGARAAWPASDRYWDIKAETLPVINKPKHPKKGEYKEQNGRTHVQEDKRTNLEGEANHKGKTTRGKY